MRLQVANPKFETIQESWHYKVLPTGILYLILDVIGLKERLKAARESVVSMLEWFKEEYATTQQSYAPVTQEAKTLKGFISLFGSHC